MPPTVARGILGGIHSYRQRRWTINRIGICNPIRLDVIEIATDRGVRRCLALHDVGYLIEASWHFTEGMLAKWQEMFHDTVVAGQRPPHLGVYDHPARLTICPPSAWTNGVLQDRTADLGWMLYDLNGSKHARARFFRATVINGVLDLYSRPEDIALFS